MLAADEGSYLLPIWPEAGYAETGLTEPWACVEAAYAIPIRPTVQPGGTVWIVGLARGNYILDGEFNPGRVIATRPPANLLATLRDWALSRDFKLVEAPLLSPAEACERYTAGTGFDDIILLGRPEQGPESFVSAHDGPVEGPAFLEQSAAALAHGG